LIYIFTHRTLFLIRNVIYLLTPIVYPTEPSIHLCSNNLFVQYKIKPPEVAYIPQIDQIL